MAKSNSRQKKRDGEQSPGSLKCESFHKKDMVVKSGLRFGF